MHYPVLLDIHERTVLVIGGGKVAERKVRALLDCGARVRVIAPELTPALRALADEGTISREAREYREGDVTGAALAVVAVDDDEVSRAAADECRRLGVFVNTVDKPDLCDFIVPSVLRRGPMTIAVSTGGASPAWAKTIRERLEGEFDAAYARVLEISARIRKRCLEEIGDPARRRRVLESLADEGLLTLARKVDLETLEREMAKKAGLGES